MRNREPDRSPMSQTENLAPDEHARNRGIIEALLIASDLPVGAAKIAAVLDRVETREIRTYVDDLNTEYGTTGRSFKITEVARRLSDDGSPGICHLGKTPSARKISGKAFAGGFGDPGNCSLQATHHQGRDRAYSWGLRRWGDPPFDGKGSRSDFGTIGQPGEAAALWHDPGFFEAFRDEDTFGSAQDAGTRGASPGRGGQGGGRFPAGRSLPARGKGFG